MMELLHRFKIFYESLSANQEIIPGNSRFWDYLNLPMPASSIHVADVFHELIGLEEDIQKILKTDTGELKIPVISRSGAKGRNLYFNLSILTSPDYNVPALVVIEDETDVMRAQQQVVQSNNEIILLKHDLEKQNIELFAANEQLDILGKDLSEKNIQLNKLINVIRTQNHDLESKVRIRTRELFDSRLEIINRLAQAAEYRDPDTGSHIYRIGRSSVLIAKHAGLSGGECDTLLHASLLHDVGKVGIPDSILMKPAGLSTEEWSVMRKHTFLGAKLLSNNSSHFVEYGRVIALNHHEKWDGSGYPEGLKGGAIHPYARICAIADVFDALTSERPYKKPWSVDRAAAEIKQESGKSFDPSYVESFFAVIDDIVKLRLQSEIQDDTISEL